MRDCRDELAQTKAILVEAVAEKEQFKELSKAGEQKLKEQVSMLKDEHRMAVFQAKSAKKELKLESRKMHDCQEEFCQACQPMKSWSWSRTGVKWQCRIVKMK
jgi:hypothetical protein